MARSSQSDPKNRKIFVSYAWGDNNHQSDVRSFTNHLRENGFHAEMDNFLSQEETSINFKKMMYTAMQHEKVIIVLSPQYKMKADKFEGGVGTEFQLLINDINNAPKKYILLTLDGISKDLIPFGLQGYEIVDFRHRDGEEMLFRKILDQKKYDFSPVKEISHQFNLEPIEPLYRENHFVKIEDPSIEIIYTSGRNSGYARIDLGLIFTFRNISSAPLDCFGYVVKVKEEMLNTSFALTSQDGIYHLGNFVDEEIEPGACIVTDRLDIVIETKHVKTLFRHPLVFQVEFSLGSGQKFAKRKFSIENLIPFDDSLIPLELIKEVKDMKPNLN